MILFKMKKLMCGIITLLAYQCSYAVNRDLYTFDVYQSNQINAVEVEKTYRKQLETIATVMNNAKKAPISDAYKDLNSPVEIIITGVRKNGDFAYLQLSPIFYSGDQKMGFTLDAVDQSDKARLEGFMDPQKGDMPDPDHLIKDWQDYEKYAFSEFFRTRVAKDPKKCPAFHCVYGFDDPAVSHYGVKFSAEVPRYKNELVAVLRNDKDEFKRGTAAYLLAHLKNGDEIVKILAPSILDSSSNVRNNVMRVLAQTVLKAKNPEINKELVIKTITFPTTVDRNKGLYLMESLSERPVYARYFKSHACREILDQLKLTQPNLHGGAYAVLKKISGEKYSDTDINAWEGWARKSCPQQYKA